MQGCSRYEVEVETDERESPLVHFYPMGEDRLAKPTQVRATLNISLSPNVQLLMKHRPTPAAILIQRADIFGYVTETNTCPQTFSGDPTTIIGTCSVCRSRILIKCPRNSIESTVVKAAFTCLVDSSNHSGASFDPFLCQKGRVAPAIDQQPQNKPAPNECFSNSTRQTFSLGFYSLNFERI